MSIQLAQQADAGRAATTQEQAVRQERHIATRAAAAVLAADYPASIAWDILVRSVERQARLAGVGRVDLGAHPGPESARRWVVTLPEGVPH